MKNKVRDFAKKHPALHKAGPDILIALERLLIEQDEHIRKELNKPVKYGCTIEGGNEAFSSCVIDTGKTEDCFYYKESMNKKEDCPYWEKLNLETTILI